MSNITRPPYLRHTMSFADDLVLGVVVGIAFGIWNLIATYLDPLADDTPLALLIFYGPMFTAWGYAGFGAKQRSSRIVEAIVAGATVAFVTFVIFWIANLVRVNLFLETIRNRADWQNLVLRFQQSGFDSFRAFVNYEYLTGAPMKIFVPCVIGAIVGLIGGMCAVAMRREPQQIPLP